MPRVVAFGKTGTAGDDYKSFAELVNLPQDGAGVPRLIEGFLACSAFGVTYLYVEGSRPATADAGVPMAVDDKAGIGPTGPATPWNLSHLWVRNTTPGSNGKLTVTGVALVGP